MSRLFQDNQIIGDYRIRGFLGAGGMGEVYLGVHLQFNHLAAIKVLANLVSSDSMTTRFHNEARVQSGLQHLNIATLYDFKSINGNLCIFMEYIDGESLDDLINRNFFAVEESLMTFHSICEAVSFIHRRGILHRDIKAQNIKLNSKGLIKLLDFGIAKDAESQKLTKTGGVIGTPSYIAPEQFKGKPADFQTDVWALGVLFYEMLTGKHPFRAEGIMELCLKIESGEYVPVEKANPSVPPEIARIVKRCLQKEKNRRYRNASELSRETARVLAEKYDLTMTDSGSFTRISSLNQTFQPIEDFVRESPPKQKNNWRIPVIWASSISVFLVFCVIAVGFWAISGEGENVVVVSKGTNKNEIFIVKKNDSANYATKPFIETSAASGDLIDVKIDVFEGSAEIVRNGENVGKTPFTLKGRTGEKVNIKLRREGYKDYETQIEFSSGKRNYTFSLQKK